MRILILLLLLLIFSCNKDSNSNQSASLKINPTVVGCSNDNVRIRLYESESDYQTTSNLIEEKYSDGDNGVVFTGLEEKIYYFKCSKPCSAGGTGMTANNFCDPSIEVYQTNGSLSSSFTQEVEVQLCY